MEAVIRSEFETQELKTSNTHLRVFILILKLPSAPIVLFVAFKQTFDSLIAPTARRLISSSSMPCAIVDFKKKPLIQNFLC